MNDEELEALLSEIESDRVERKSAISDRDKIHPVKRTWVVLDSEW
jgi:hypothetical protein